MTNYVATYENKEFFKDVNGSSEKYGINHYYDDIANEAVRHWGIKTSRKNPEFILVSVYKLEIKKGKVERNICKNCTVPLPLPPMTEQEFAQEINEIVESIPEEFHSFVCTYSWSEGHSSGYENVVSICQELVDMLRPAIRRFQDRIKKSNS